MARYYSATTGSFWSPDPGSIHTADSGTPNSWNRYPYAGGDPVNHIDPSGLELMLVTGNCVLDGQSVGCSQLCDPTGNLSDAYAPLYGDQPNPCDAAPGGSSGDGDEGAGDSGPTCEQLLTSAISSFLTGKGSPLASDAAYMVTVGAQDNIDPTLFAAIAVAENGTAANNPFALGPNGRNTYPDLNSAISAVGSQLKKYIYTWKEGSVSALWSGNAWMVEQKKPWITIQPPAYCVATGKTPGQIAQAQALCQNTGNTIAGFMQKMGQKATVGGDPNNLAFPCKDEEDEEQQ